MEHTLKNGKTVQIRLPGAEDAQAMIALIATADGETPFLGRNAGEFHPSLEKERALHLYESFGFEISGIFPRAMRYPDGSYADEYRMVKFL